MGLISCIQLYVANFWHLILTNYREVRCYIICIEHITKVTRMIRNASLLVESFCQIRIHWVIRLDFLGYIWTWKWNVYGNYLPVGERECLVVVGVRMEWLCGGCCGTENVWSAYVKGPMCVCVFVCMWIVVFCAKTYSPITCSVSVCLNTFVFRKYEHLRLR